MVLAPASPRSSEDVMAAARTGIRLGRGGGYYDRALQHARRDARVVVLLYDEEFVDELPAEPHDRRVTVVVTPSGGWQELGATGSRGH